ncbi:MAG: hypothetical protein ACAH12_05540 [Methylophilaceae bacterium]
MPSNIKYIIGSDVLIDHAAVAWREVEPDTEIRILQLKQNTSYQFDFSALDNISMENVSAFSVFDAQFLNFRRYELMGELKSRGFKMPPLICKGALVANTAVVAENVMIGPLAIIGHHCKIGFNSVIGAGANIGNGTKIGHSAWIEAGIIIGQNASIGANTTLGLGVMIANDIEIGKLSIIDQPGKISHSIPAKTFIHSEFDEPIVVFENQSRHLKSTSSS